MQRRTFSSWRPGGAARTALGAAVILLALLASCNDPNAPAPGSSSTELDYLGDWDGGQTLVFRLESPVGGASPLQLLASDLNYEPSTQELRAQVAIRNTGAIDVQGPSHVLVGDFDPTEVQPLNAEPLPCPACVGCPCPWPWAFAHAGTYGDDGVLGAGESSAPVEWILFVPAGESFSFRARVQHGITSPQPGVISGSVFVDVNRNGQRDPGEIGLPGASLTLTHGDVGASALTDERGHYGFEVSEAGLYEISWDGANCALPTTPLHRQVLIVQRPDSSLSGYDRADFGCAGDTPPDTTAVDVQGLVFEDSNRNGVPDPGEAGLPGVRIVGSTPMCPTFAPIVALTNEAGLYRMQLPPCMPPYVIHREPLAGYVDTTPNPVVFGPRRDPGTGPGPGGPGSDPRPPTTPMVTLRANFGVARADASEGYSVEGFVYVDSNRNGQLDAGEPGVGDVGVSAAGTECMTPVIGLTRTDASGHYVLHQREIHCRPPWMVQHEPVAGHCDTSANPVHVSDWPLPPQDGVFRVDFGIAPCDSVPPPPGFGIDGYVWRDTDRDGVREAGEPGLPGAQVQLVSPCERLWVATTDANGYYAFDPTGWCLIQAVALTQPAGVLHTTPNPFPVDPNTVPPGSMMRVDFGIAPMRRQ